MAAATARIENSNLLFKTDSPQHNSRICHPGLFPSGIHRWALPVMVAACGCGHANWYPSRLPSRPSFLRPATKNQPLGARFHGTRQRI